MDKQRVHDLAVGMEAAMQDWATKNGVTVKRAGGTYDAGGTATLRFEVVERGAEPRIERDFREYISAYGLSPSDLGRTFVSKGVVHTIAGLKTAARVRPIVTVTDDGRTFDWPVSLVTGFLSK